MLSYSPALEKLIPLSEILPILAGFFTVNIRNFRTKQNKMNKQTKKPQTHVGSYKNQGQVLKCSSSHEVKEHEPQVSAGSLHPNCSNPKTGEYLKEETVL